MKLWRIPEESGDHVPDSTDRTGLIVMAETAEEAVKLARAHQADLLAPYPTSKDWMQYDQVEPIDGPIYKEPMYGYSW